MIFKSRNSTSPSVSISIDGVATDYSSIRNIELHLGVSKHDYLQITIHGIASSLLVDYLKAGVLVSWTQGPYTTKFHGYIASVEPEYQSSAPIINDSPFQTTVLHCFGASYDMRGKRNHTWTNTNIQKIATELAKKYQYSVSVPTQTLSIPRVVQTNESDWEFLVKMSYLSGFHVTIHGTHIHIWDSSTAMSRAVSFHRVENTRAKRGSITTDPGTIMQVTGTLGETTDPWNTHTKRLVSLDDYGAIQTIEKSDSESVYGKLIKFDITDELSKSAPTRDVAELLLSSVNGRLTSFDLEVVVGGLAGVLPGGIVHLSDFQSQLDGFWYVHDVVHQINQNEYYSTLRLCKNATNEEVVTILPVPELEEPPVPAFLEKSWRSSVELENVYG